MALFGSKKNTQPSQSRTQGGTVAAHLPARTAGEVFGVLKHPHLTEKSAIVSDRGVYVFAIAPNATKYDVAQAVATIYNVTPVRVNIVRMRPRTEGGRTRRFVNRQTGIKKAYVYLKQGDRIEFT